MGGDLNELSEIFEVRDLAERYERLLIVSEFSGYTLEDVDNMTLADRMDAIAWINARNKASNSK